MYSIYLNPTTSYNSMSLNDYIELQNARAKEQERQRRIQQEEIRLANAIHQLRAIREIQREREERAAQAYYQELARLREQEFIRQERERQMYQNYVNALKNQYHCPQPATKSAMFYHPNDVLATCSASAENEYASESDSEAEEEENQYPQLINVLFGGASQEGSSKGQTYTREKKNATGTPVELPIPTATVEKQEEDSQERQANAMNVDQFMDFFYDRLQKFNEAEDETQANEAQENQEQDQDTTEEHEPHLVPLLQDEDQDMEEAENLVSIAGHDTEHDGEAPSIINNTLVTEEEKATSATDNNGNESAAFEQQSENLASLFNEDTVSDDSQRESSFPNEDAVKLAKYDALNRIEQELVEIQLKNASILQNSLDFDTSSHDSDTLYANTANNREFLGYEDQIVKIMLKLDMINSDGDEDVRTERKNLVKRAEKLLEVLDDFKHREWERASNSSEYNSEDEYVMA
ncbi:hypothetical protein K501DRAFT_286122 [Backusella circina FSU 941]|nr:hypothetical protein K501DRAFT_286122 [Backusella circina FSU 941]